MNRRPEGRRARPPEGRRSRSGSRYDAAASDETMWLTELSEEPDPDEEEWTGELRAIRANAPHAKAPPPQAPPPQAPPPQAPPPAPPPFPRSEPPLPPAPAPPVSQPWGPVAGAMPPAPPPQPAREWEPPWGGSDWSATTTRPDVPDPGAAPGFDLAPRTGTDPGVAGFDLAARADPTADPGYPGAPPPAYSFGRHEAAADLGGYGTPDPAGTLGAPSYGNGAAPDPTGGLGAPSYGNGAVPDPTGGPGVPSYGNGWYDTGGAGALEPQRPGGVGDTGSWSLDPNETGAWDPDFLTRPWSGDSRELEPSHSWEPEPPQPTGYGSLFADPAPSLWSPSPGQEPAWDALPGQPGGAVEQDDEQATVRDYAPGPPSDPATSGQWALEQQQPAGWQPDEHPWLWSAGDLTSPGIRADQDPWAQAPAAPWAEPQATTATPPHAVLPPHTPLPQAQPTYAAAVEQQPVARAWQPEPLEPARDAWFQAAAVPAQRERIAELDVDDPNVEALGGRRVREPSGAELRRASELHRGNGNGDSLARLAELRRAGQAGGRRLRPEAELQRPRWPRVVAVVTWILLAMVVIWFYVFPWLERVLPSNF